MQVAMESKVKFKWCCKLNFIFSNSQIIVFLFFILSIKYMYFVKYHDCISLIVHFFDFIYQSINFQTFFTSLVDICFCSPLQKYLVYDLNPNCTSKNPNLTIIFFMGLFLGKKRNGRKHGQHASRVIEKRAYVGQKYGSQRT